MSAACSAARGEAQGVRPPNLYRRRRPENTVAYPVVQQHLETWLAHHRETNPDDDPIPTYVERDFRRFLECGILAHGFARAHCDECGQGFLIAYSCDERDAQVPRWQRNLRCIRSINRIIQNLWF